MIRGDKEITDIKEIEAVLERAGVLRIAMAGDEPYIVPVNFVYRNGSIYVHSAARGKKIEMLRRDPRVCFETDLYFETVRADRPCNWGMKYLSVIGTGTARITDDTREKEEALRALMEKYSGSGDWRFEEKELRAVAVIIISVSSLTGKRSGINGMTL